MTLEQAIEVLISRYNSSVIRSRTNDDEWRLATDTVIAALRSHDPDTGLVPCGCGGKAGFHYSVMMRDNDCYVGCGVCGEHSKVALSEDKARDAWNTAMGCTADGRPHIEEQVGGG